MARDILESNPDHICITNLELISLMVVFPNVHQTDKLSKKYNSVIKSQVQFINLTINIRVVLHKFRIEKSEYDAQNVGT